LCTRLSSVVREFAIALPLCARDPPRPVQPTGGSSVALCRSHYLMVRRCYRSLQARRRNRETVRSATTPRHRHHLPGIKKCPSDSYVEIGSDGLRTRLSSVVREFALNCSSARPTPPVQHTPGVSCGSVQVATFNSQRAVTALPSSPSTREHEQRELHATVTICPELKLPHQKVARKLPRTVGARDCRTLCANLH
jgi:hypothetical protein